MATGYYSLSGVTVVAGGLTLTATHVAAPGAAADPANFVNLVGLEGAEGTPAGHGILGPAGQVGIVRHAVDATTLRLSKPWVGAAIAGGTAELILGINALPIGKLATLITQIMVQRPLVKTNNLSEYAGDTDAQEEIATNLGLDGLTAGALRADIVQAFTAPQQAQARRNAGIHVAADPFLAAATTAAQRTALGITAPGNALVTAASVAAQRSALQITASGEALVLAPSVAIQRSLLGQKWVTLFDQTITGSPVFGVAADLFGFDMVRVTARIVPNPAVADFFMYWRGSADGVTYDNGATDYAQTIIYQTGATITAFAVTQNTYGQVTGTIDTGTPSYCAEIEALFFRGSGSLSPRMQTRTSEYSGSARAQTLIMSDRSAAKAFTHLMLASNVANAVGIGSRFIVEGS